MATAPVENPGLIPEEQIYTGTVKHNINPNTGYGFVQDVFIGDAATAVAGPVR